MLPRMPDSSAARPRDGIRVIEVADESAAYGTRLLADLGADVVMVEPAEGGPVRRLAPFVDGERGAERGTEHLLLNVNKRSVRLDRDGAGDQRRFLDLIAASTSTSVFASELEPTKLRKPSVTASSTELPVKPISTSVMWITSPPSVVSGAPVLNPMIASPASSMSP